MNKTKSKCTKKFYELFLPFEVERFDRLDTEFRNEEEVRELLEKKRLLYDFLMDNAPDELKSSFVEYDDNNFHIGDLQRKYHYKKGFFDCAAIMRFLFRMKSNITLNMHIL